MSLDRRRRLPWALIVMIVVVGIGAAWTVGLVRFVRAIPDEVADLATRTDAIVVLTGGSERLHTGLELLSAGKAERVFVSGVHESVDLEELLALEGKETSMVASRVEAGHGARDTAGNALETAGWMRNRGYGSLRLVTASYHMPRSLLQFRHALPEAEIVAHPVFPDHVKQSRWWAWPGTATLIIGEYNKFLLAWFAHRAAALIGQEESGARS